MEGNEPVAALVPQDQAYASEAFGQREPVHSADSGWSRDNLWQPVKGDPAARPDQHNREMQEQEWTDARRAEEVPNGKVCEPDEY